MAVFDALQQRSSICSLTASTVQTIRIITCGGVRRGPRRVRVWPLSEGLFNNTWFTREWHLHGYTNNDLYEGSPVAKVQIHC
jgi:hypothetical protein